MNLPDKLEEVKRIKMVKIFEKWYIAFLRADGSPIPDALNVRFQEAREEKIIEAVLLYFHVAGYPFFSSIYTDDERCYDPQPQEKQ